jgi:hypothetical protein
MFLESLTPPNIIQYYHILLMSGISLISRYQNVVATCEDLLKAVAVDLSMLIDSSRLGLSTDIVAIVQIFWPFFSRIHARISCLIFSYFSPKSKPFLLHISLNPNLNYPLIFSIENYF